MRVCCSVLFTCLCTHTSNIKASHANASYRARLSLSLLLYYYLIFVQYKLYDHLTKCDISCKRRLLSPNIIKIIFSFSVTLPNFVKHVHASDRYHFVHQHLQHFGELTGWWRPWSVSTFLHKSSAEINIFYPIFRYNHLSQSNRWSRLTLLEKRLAILSAFLSLLVVILLIIVIVLAKK